MVMFNDIQKPGFRKNTNGLSGNQKPAKDPTDLGPVPPLELSQTPVVFDVPEPVVPGANKSHFWDFSWTFSKRTNVIIGAVVGVLLVGGLVAVWQTHATDMTGVYQSKKLPSTKPVETRVPSSLTGLLVDPAVNNKPVIGVMIENSLDSRPQSGLAEAGVVFEAIAEGGITRFLALYQDTEPELIGPVRSARPYYVQWCGSFDCTYAHVGGSPEALAFIRSSGTKDMDQFANGGAYNRVSHRYAPHNVYTSSAKLQQLASSKGFTASTFTPFARKSDAPSKTPNATTVAVRISSKNYNSTYAYDAATNSYIRSQNDAPHTSVDSKNAQLPIKPKVVVALTMGYGVASDKHSQYATTGTGAGTIFQDGVATPITWAKADTKSPITFTNAAGAPVALNAGQTWVVAVANSSFVTHQ